MTRLASSKVTKSPKHRRRTHDGRPGRWLLQDAKARFSELVRRVRSEGPQHVTVHGRDEVVVIAAEEFRRLKGDLPGKRSFPRCRHRLIGRSTLNRALRATRARCQPVTGWLLDTNVLSELRRRKPEPKVVAFIAAQALDSLYISSVTLAEIRFGIELLTDADGAQN